MSDAHIQITLRAQAASGSEPHALANAHIPSTLRCVNLLLPVRCFYSYAVRPYLLETPLGFVVEKLV